MKYAAIIKSQIRIPGDERSRTNPGHGYPEHWRDVIDLVEFSDLDTLEKWAANEQKQYLNRTVRYIEYSELDMVTEVKVKARRR